MPKNLHFLLMETIRFSRELFQKRSLAAVGSEMAHCVEDQRNRFHCSSSLVGFIRKVKLLSALSHRRVDVEEKCPTPQPHSKEGATYCWRWSILRAENPFVARGGLWLKGKRTMIFPRCLAGLFAADERQCTWLWPGFWAVTLPPFFKTALWETKACLDIWGFSISD